MNRLTARYREHRESLPGPARIGRHESVGNTRDANAVVDLVAIAESFAVARWSSFAAAEAKSTWKDRRKQWLQQGVEFSSCPTWDQVAGFIEARNAVQHNLGRLTERQLNLHKDSVMPALVAAGVMRNGDALLLRSADVDRCMAACKTFIEWLDTTAPLPTP